MSRPRTYLPPAPLVVVVDGTASPAHQLRRCVSGVLATTPAGTRVLVVPGAGNALPRAVGRRVTVVRSGGDHLAREVAQEKAVLVIPAACAPVDARWCSTALLRLEQEPDVIGVVDTGAGLVLAHPARVTSPRDPRVAWAPLPGLQAARPPVPVAAGAAPPVHRTVAAVLIVKDEEDDLERSLLAVLPFVDEVVVYDTGSTDRTVEIARRHAVVHEGFWDDDFGAARNRAIEHSSSDWVFIIDADEVVEGVPDEVRALLDSTAADTCAVGVLSTSWVEDEVGQEVRSVRIFRRERAHYEGALHEQVVPRPGRGGLAQHPGTAPVRIRHSGYDRATMLAKNKSERNTAISGRALAALAPDDPRRPDAVANHGRSLALTGDRQGALGVLRELLRNPAPGGNMLQAARVAVPSLLAVPDHEDVEAWLAAAVENGESVGQVAVWRAALHVSDGDLDTAEDVMAALGTTGGLDAWGIPFDKGTAETLRAEIDLLRGRGQQAAERMLAELHRSPHSVSLQVLFDACGSVGMTMGDLIARAPQKFLDRSLRDMVVLPPATSLRWLAALSAHHPNDVRPVVAGCVIAARCSWVEALEWEARALEAGLADVHPLEDLAMQEARPLEERVVAWGLVAAASDDPAALGRVFALLEEAGPEERERALRLLLETVPGVLDTVAVPPDVEEPTGSALGNEASR